MLINPAKKHHIAMLYDTLDEDDSIIASYLNEGLRKGEICVYVTSYYVEQGYIEKFFAVYTGNLLRSTTRE